MNSQPPVAASWLLTRFGFVPDNEVLLGDLAEEYGRGRSSAWYWRQVFGAIAMELLKTARYHNVLLVRAIAIGWALTYVWFHYALWYLIGHCLELLAHFGYKPPVWIDSYGSWFLLLSVGCMGATLIGWIVGRLHRPYAMQMVIAYAIFAIALNCSEIFRLVSDSSGGYPRFLPYLRLVLTQTVLQALCALVGGLFSVPNRRPVVHVESV